jgi:peptidyl-tRNA hydrolase
LSKKRGIEEIPPKLVQKRGIEEIPPRTPLTLELGKPQNRVPLLTYLGGESQPKEPRRVPTNFPHQIPKSKVPKTTQRNHQERAPKITTKNNRKQHIQTLKNHAESSMHATKVLKRSSLLPDHPTLSQDLTMKLSS